MTVLDASNLLFQFFLKNNSFCLEEDFIKLVTVSDVTERHKAAIVAALDSFEKNGIIKSTRIDDKYYYTLTKSLSALEQNVIISGETAVFIAERINAFCELLGGSNEVCNPSDIKEEDIKYLIIALDTLMNKSEETNENPMQEEDFGKTGEIE